MKTIQDLLSGKSKNISLIEKINGIDYRLEKLQDLRKETQKEPRMLVTFNHVKERKDYQSYGLDEFFIDIDMNEDFFNCMSLLLRGKKEKLLEKLILEDN